MATKEGEAVVSDTGDVKPSTKVDSADAINAETPEARRAQAEEYIFSIIDEGAGDDDGGGADDTDGVETDGRNNDDDATNDSNTVDDDGGRGSDSVRNQRKLERKLKREQAELQQKVEALKSKDPEELLTALGFDKDEIIDRLVLGKDYDSADSTDTDIAKRLARIEAAQQERELEAAKSEAIKEVGKRIQEDDHFWLMQESKPSEIVLQTLRELRREDPDSTIEEAAEHAENLYRSRAERILKASKRPEKSADAATVGKNLKNTGGSVKETHWNDLPVEERRRRELARIKKEYDLR